MMYLTEKKVAVTGAAGAVGSNCVQDLLSTGTASRVAMYDPHAPGLEAVAEEMLACAYPGAELSWSTDAGEVLEGASYVIACGGAPRRKGMRREDLLLTNCPVARGLGQDIRRYCPDVQYVIVVFNPADITGLTVLVHSGLKPGYVSTLAALDSTRLRTALAGYFSVRVEAVTGCATYGGHGEKMAVFAAGIAIDGVPLTSILEGAAVNGRGMAYDDWRAIQDTVRAAGNRLIALRGRPSFQSPAHQSVEMLRARVTCADYPWPCGAYFADGPFAHVMMAAPVRFSVFGMQPLYPEGNEEDMEALRESYAHLCRLRDTAIGARMLPPVSEWQKANANL